jgi:hypothetical protein
MQTVRQREVAAIMRVLRGVMKDKNMSMEEAKKYLLFEISDEGRDRRIQQALAEIQKKKEK